MAEALTFLPIPILLGAEDQWRKKVMQQRALCCVMSHAMASEDEFGHHEKHSLNQVLDMIASLTDEAERALEPLWNARRICENEKLKGTPRFDEDLERCLAEAGA